MPLYVGGDLPATAMDGLARHLRACRACGALEARAVRARGVLLQGLQARAAEPAPDLLVGLRAKLAASNPVMPAAALASNEVATEAAGARVLFFPRRRRLALAGCVAAAALLSWAFFAREDALGTSPEARSVVAVEPAPPEAARAAPPLVADFREPAASQPAPAVRQSAPVALLGVVADDDALRPLRTSETPLRHAAVRTVEVPWIEGNPGRVLTPGGSVSTVGFGGLPR